MGRIFVTGDIHQEASRRLSSRHFYSKNLTKNDVVIVAGDFGLVWSHPGGRFYKKETYELNWLNNATFTTLFIDGNHENFDLLNKLPTANLYGADVGVVNESVYHLRRGRTYNINGKSVLTIGGAQSVDMESRVSGIDYWKEELLSTKEQNDILDCVDDKLFDFVITHTAPRSVIKSAISLPVTEKVTDNTTKFLDEVCNRISFRNWFCGHFHENVICGEFIFLYDYIVEAKCL